VRLPHWFILVLALLTLAALIPPSIRPREDRSLLLTVWGMPFEDLLFHDFYADGFEAQHPGWTVEYQRHNDIVEKYKAWHLQGRGADVMRLGIDHYHAMVQLGIIAPLDEFMHDPEIGLTEEELADYPPAIMEVLEIDGRIHALPSDNAQYGLYYNRAIFEAHSDNPIHSPSAEWTWEDLKRAADALTVRDERGNIVQYGIAFDLWAWPFFTFLKQAGGEMWDADQTTTLINSPPGVEALEFLVSLIPPDAPMRAEEFAGSGAGPADLFKVGKVAILLDGSWRAPNIEQDQPDLDFAIAPLPRHRERAVVNGSVLWAISAHSDHKEMAWRMIKWMTSFEGSLAYWDMLRVAPPARISVIESDEFRETRGFVDPVTGDRRAAMPREKYDDRAAWLSDAITPDPETGDAPGFVPASPYQNDLQQAVTVALVAAVRGEKSPREALDDAAAAVHAIIDRDRRSRGLAAVRRTEL